MPQQTLARRRGLLCPIKPKSGLDGGPEPAVQSSEFWVGFGIGFGSPKGDAWITQASRVGHAWVTLGSNGGSAFIFNKS